MQDIRDGLHRLFPDTADAIITLASGGTIDDPVLRSRALSDLAGGFDLSDRDSLAMDYRGRLGSPAAFCDYAPCEYDTRECLDAVVMVDRDTGLPVGAVPLPEHTETVSSVCDVLKGFRGTVVTDRVPFDDREVRALDRWGTDWVIVLPPFPDTVSAVNPKMSSLRHGDRDYETCKVRYSKHWLFRFTDLAERERLLANMGCTGKPSSRLEKGAGITDAVSGQSFDIRQIRKMLDLRSSTDSAVRRVWSSLPGDRESAFARLCLAAIGEALH